ncbi:hypothetical protein H4R20_001117 [Coemansia guatemalensis]|uniref:Major facilitator superfamily (MFS) profile domain-containing protein n=1 Tax=Coemansia guatemalensis TaxID=2761395 RepID=A0A9W8HZS3_9FUNG|nr:hypothetical protein H4R20_001117 [Coemansia guatemalensis]
MGAVVAIFIASLQATVPESFFVQAVGPWGVDVSSLWMSAAYLIGYVAFVLPAMRISDVFGRLSTFWFGIAMFVIFTGVSGNAGSAYTFAVLRAFQGVGAGIMTSVAVVVVGTHTSERSRGLYVSGLAAAQLFGIGAAHIIGGKLAIDDKFRWGVYIAAPLAAVPAILCTPALVAERKWLRPSESFFRRVLHFDYIGSLLLLGTSIMLTSGLTFGGNEHAWDSATVLCLLIFGTVSGALFILWEAFGAKHPVFNSRWLKERNLQISMAGVLFMSMAFFANAVYVPIMYITVRTQTTDIAGRMTAPYWGTSIGAAVLVVGSVLRWKPTLARPMVWVGLLIATVFSGVYYTIEVEPSTLSKERAFYALAGLGIGLAYPSIIYLAQVSVPRDESGSAAAVAHFLSIVGGMLGMILYQACLKSRLIHNLVPIFEQSTFLSSFNVHTMDIAGLEMSGGTMLTYEPDRAVLIGEKMMDSLRTTFVLSVPFLGTALILSLLYKRHFS